MRESMDPSRYMPVAPVTVDELPRYLVQEKVEASSSWVTVAVFCREDRAEKFMNELKHEESVWGSFDVSMVTVHGPVTL